MNPKPEFGQLSDSCTKTGQWGWRSVAAKSLMELRKVWLRGLDLNQRPLGYEPNELPDCSTPRDHYIGAKGNWQRDFQQDGIQYSHGN